MREFRGESIGLPSFRGDLLSARGVEVMSNRRNGLPHPIRDGTRAIPGYKPACILCEKSDDYASDYLNLKICEHCISTPPVATDGLGTCIHGPRETICSRCPRCPSCQSPWADPSNPDNLVSVGKLKLYTADRVFVPTCYDLRCSNPACPITLPYDGISDGIYVHSRPRGELLGTAFVLEVMMDYDEHFRAGLISYREYHKKLQSVYSMRAQALREDDNSPPWRTTLRVLRSFIQLRLAQSDLTYAFSCPICSSLPHENLVLVIDGITLGMRRCFYKPLPNFAPIEPAVYILNDTPFQKYPKVRKLLWSLSQSDGLSIESWTELLNLLNKAGHPFNHLAHHLNNEAPLRIVENKVMFTSASARAFFRGIAQPQPACGFFSPSPSLPANVLSLMILQDEPLSDAQLNTIRLGFPQLYNYILLSDSRMFPASLRPFLLYYIRVATAALQLDPLHVPDQRPLEDPYRDHMIAPTFPLVRMLRRYHIDERSSGNKCTKVELRHPYLTPGVMHMCCPHGIALLAFIMPRYEGPTIPFELLFTRFLSSPDTLVYDNACNLHVSCMKREPAFFAKTKFFSDRLHWRDHTNCSTGYNLDSMEPSLPVLLSSDGETLLTFKDLNSQVSEQLNSKLTGARTQMAYMGHEAFVSYLTYILMQNNLEKRKAL